MRHGYFNLNIGRVLLPPLHWCNGNVTLGNAINSGEVRLETDGDDDDDDGGGGTVAAMAVIRTTGSVCVCLRIYYTLTCQ